MEVRVGREREGHSARLQFEACEQWVVMEGEREGGRCSVNQGQRSRQEENNLFFPPLLCLQPVRTGGLTSG